MFRRRLYAAVDPAKAERKLCIRYEDELQGFVDQCFPASGINDGLADFCQDLYTFCDYTDQLLDQFEFGHKEVTRRPELEDLWDSIYGALNKLSIIANKRYFVHSSDLRAETLRVKINRLNRKYEKILYVKLLDKSWKTYEELFTGWRDVVITMAKYADEVVRAAKAY